MFYSREFLTLDSIHPNFIVQIVNNIACNTRTFGNIPYDSSEIDFLYGPSLGESDQRNRLLPTKIGWLLAGWTLHHVALSVVNNTPMNK
jgi:hypothetical protein